MRNVRLAAVVAALAVVTVLATVSPSPAARGPVCPAGYSPVGSEASRLRSPAAKAARVAATDRSGTLCLNDKHPESFADVAARDGQFAAQHYGGIDPNDPTLGALQRQALQQKAALAAARAKSAPVPGATGGSWAPYGRGPLMENDPTYGVSAEGLQELNGRVDSLAYDPAHKRIFSTVGTGGVWMSTNNGDTWHSIGEGLPSQVVGSVGWSAAKGGTLIVASGEPIVAYGARVGLGVFYSRDLGKTWHHAAGVPDGALGFKIAVDPGHPTKVYAATSRGLFASTDAGVTFKNTKLPTGECAGKVDSQRCTLANMVTDVVVQPGDKYHHQGGRVLAVVGYRAGARPFPQSSSDVLEGPWNGLYRSDNGAPGTFQLISTPHDSTSQPGRGSTGFAEPERIGNTKLGVASGPNQNADYVYAIVQDAVVFRGGYPSADVPADAWSGVSISVLNGIYVSGDFGSTWTLMADSNQIDGNAASGSALNGTGAAQLYAPGVQAWYNEWIQPDPTLADANGVPMRLVFGLEEIWENDIITQPANGETTFHVIGRYFAGNVCLFLTFPVPYCPTSPRDPNAPTTTHPDQHAGMFVPDGSGGVTLFAGNDGGTYKQHLAQGEDFTNTKWGAGINKGYNTLLPYDAVAAKDGTVWMGLQDNGSVKILPDTRKQVGAFGGDGFFMAVDPNNSDEAWSETPGAGMRYTADGGKTWTDCSPGVSNAQFSNPFVMDPKNHKHLITAGTEVAETLDGAESCTSYGDPDIATVTPSNSWNTVFNLGTHDHPGKAPGLVDGQGLGLPGEDDSAPNQMSAVDVLGDNAYVAYCGPCDIMNTATPLVAGIATNVGGDAAPKAGSSAGWHLAAARGLPFRYVTWVAIDPTNPKVVYATLGGYGRGWRAPGSYGDKNKRIGRGHVYKSTDAGNSFKDISGQLPNTPANSIALRGSQLIVGTDLGVYISSDKSGSSWAELGSGLPNVPTVSVQMQPGHSNTLIVATFGRGVYSYTFPSASKPKGKAAAAPSKKPVARASVSAAADGSPAGSRGPLGAATDPTAVVLAAAGVALASSRTRRRRRLVPLRKTLE